MSNNENIKKLKIFDTIHDFGKKDARNNDATQDIIVSILKNKIPLLNKSSITTISDILKEITSKNITSTGSKGDIPTYERVVTDYMEDQYSDIYKGNFEKAVNNVISFEDIINDKISAEEFDVTNNILCIGNGNFSDYKYTWDSIKKPSGSISGTNMTKKQARIKIGNFILKYMYPLATIQDKFYFTFDAGSGKIGKLMSEMNQVGAIITPQNIADSAISSIKPFGDIAAKQRRFYFAGNNDDDSIFTANSTYFSNNIFQLNYQDRGYGKHNPTGFAVDIKLRDGKDELIDYSTWNRKNIPQGPSVSYLGELFYRLNLDGMKKLGALPSILQKIKPHGVIKNIGKEMGELTIKESGIDKNYINDVFGLLTDMKRDGDYGQIEQANKIKKDGFVKYITLGTGDVLCSTKCREIKQPCILQGIGGSEHKIALFRFPEGNLKITADNLFKQFQKGLSNDEKMLEKLSEILNNDSLNIKSINKIAENVQKAVTDKYYWYDTWNNDIDYIPVKIMSYLLRCKCFDIYYYILECDSLINYTLKDINNITIDIDKLKDAKKEDIIEEDKTGAYYKNNTLPYIKQYKEKKESIMNSHGKLIKLLNAIGNTFKIDDGALTQTTKQGIKNKIELFDIFKKYKTRPGEYYLKSTKEMDMSPISDFFNYKSQLHNFIYILLKSGFDSTTKIYSKTNYKKTKRKWRENIWPLLSGVGEKYNKIMESFKIDNVMFNTFKSKKFNEPNYGPNKVSMNEYIQLLFNSLNDTIEKEFENNNWRKNSSNIKTAFVTLSNDLDDLFPKQQIGGEGKGEGEDEWKDRKNQYKKGVDLDKGRNRRQETTVNIRKQKKVDRMKQQRIRKREEDVQGIRLYEILNRICLISHEFVSSFVTKMMPGYYVKYEIEQCINNINNNINEKDKNYSVYDLRMDIKNILKHLKYYKLEYNNANNLLNNLVSPENKSWDQDMTTKIGGVLNELIELKNSIKYNTPSINLWSDYITGSNKIENEEKLESTIYEIYDIWNMNLVMIRTMQEEDGYWVEDNTFQRWNGITQLLNTLLEQVCVMDSSCKDGFYLCTYNVTNQGRRSKQCQGRNIVSNLYGNWINFPNNKLKFIIVLDILYNILNDIETPYSLPQFSDILKERYTKYKEGKKTIKGWEDFTDVFNNILTIIDQTGGTRKMKVKRKKTRTKRKRKVKRKKTIRK